MPVIRDSDQEFHLAYSEEEKLNQFQTITSFPEDELPLIVKLLQSHSWNLEPALSRYFDGDWKDNLHPPAIGTRPEAFDGGAHMHGRAAFAYERPFVPALPIVTQLPHDYKEKFQMLGLEPRRTRMNTNPVLLAIMLLPNLLMRLGIGILSFLWNLFSFGMGRSDDGTLQTERFPDRPQEPLRPAADDITAVLEEESENLLELASTASFNDVWRECESKFKFMLVVFLGELVGEETDLNSQRFLKQILADPSTISLMKEHKDELEVYIATTHDEDGWYVGRHLGVRYTPECLIIANVLNSNGSVNGVTRMSILGKFRLSSLKKFQRSFKIQVERYSPELVVSRTEREEIELARKIKELQDQAFEESLRQDQIKEEKRRMEEQEMQFRKMQEEQLQHQEQLQNTTYNLYWMASALETWSTLKAGETSGKQATLQIRTSGGKRMIRKFSGDTELPEMYLQIGSHLYLDETSADPDVFATQILNKAIELSDDDEVLCFKDGLGPQPTIDGVKDIVLEEGQKWEVVTDISLAYEQGYFDFELISPFPRLKIPFDSKKSIKHISQIWPKGSLLVEAIEDAELSTGDTEDEQ
ncbi:ADR182Wp [Eremothecium gossypii ATCC 10895]|uniref:ADR182Wp n=1 Tax=Eremothecium gossypii (strain ATCC 10895 / CBS 109.51 / FGSC 9923 / NRRL Y-1056) TaxID=284811 RepID=Q759U1_EREGS|nr:ADR182Wp [Eremothecium gossypii ATCC 10895]AAS52102.1 ADR182Wp [Eremothecium gossypii ATCC 10895]AEY96401.1 FADR182Wp [Eremothecium gossypii FDAG1]